MNISLNFITAKDLLDTRNEYFATGIEGVDSLIGNIERGKVYLFYGDKEIIRILIHKLIIKGSATGKVAYLNNTDYYSRKNLIDFDLLSYYAKLENLDLDDLLKKVNFAAAYNEFRQPKAVNEFLKVINDEEIQLVIFDSIDTFLRDALNKKLAIKNLALSFYCLLKYCQLKSSALIISAEYDRLQNNLIPHFIFHSCHVAVFFRFKKGKVYAYVTKHYAKATSRKFIPIDDFQTMGRITPPFRQKYQSTLNLLQDKLMPLIRNQEYSKAFKNLVEVWDHEYAAMANSGIALVMDNLNFIANLHNKSKIDFLEKALEERDKKIHELESKIAKLEKVLEKILND